MNQIKVLGTGCASCKATEKLIRSVLEATGKAAQVEKVEDLPSIMKYGVLSTPGVVIDGKVVHAGGLPKAEDIDKWLSA